MANIGGDQLTAREIASQIVNGAVVRVVDVLSQENMFLNSAVWTPGNQGFSHIVSRVASLPTGTLRTINKGVKGETGTTYQVVETMQMRDGLSKVDSALLKNPRTRDGIRRNKDDMFVAGIGQQFAKDFVYGNPKTNPLQMLGLMPRMAATAHNVRLSGGSGDDLSSIVVIKWNSETGAALTYPEGEPLGVNVEDKGELLVRDDEGNEYFAWCTHFQVRVGLAVADERAIQRIANVEKDGTGSGEFNPDHLIDALNALPPGPGRISILCNKEVSGQIRKNAAAKANVSHSPDDPFGRPVTRVDANPIEIVEAIISAESAIS